LGPSFANDMPSSDRGSTFPREFISLRRRASFEKRAPGDARVPQSPKERGSEGSRAPDPPRKRLRSGEYDGRDRPALAAHAHP